MKRRAEIVTIVEAGGVGVELGVAEGFFSHQLLSKGVLGYLYSIDMYEGDRGHDIAQYSRAIQRLSPFRHNNAIWRMRFDDAVHLFEDGSLDFVYIDGYAHTGQEGGETLNQWYPKVKSGGIFAGHDYGEVFPLVLAEVDRFVGRHDLKLHVVHDDQQDEWNHGASSWLIIKD